MIDTFKIPTLGRILALGVYEDDDGRPHTITKFTIDAQVANKALVKMQKDMLRDKVSKFLNHRKRLMEDFGAVKTIEKVNAWTELKTHFDASVDHALDSQCKWVLRNKEKFLLIMPGQTSRFYMGDQKKIQDILSFCETILTPPSI